MICKCEKCRARMRKNRSYVCMTLSRNREAFRTCKSSSGLPSSNLFRAQNERLKKGIFLCPHCRIQGRALPGGQSQIGRRTIPGSARWGRDSKKFFLCTKKPEMAGKFAYGSVYCVSRLPFWHQWRYVSGRYVRCRLFI